MSLKENKIRTNVMKILDCIEQCIEEADGKIKTSPAARLDFALYNYFVIYCSLCASENESFLRKFENQFIFKLIGHFSKELDAETVEKILDTRIIKYDEIVTQSEASVLSDAVEQFITKDIYSDDIFDERWFIAKITQAISLKSELYSLSISTEKALLPYYNALTELSRQKQDISEEYHPEEDIPEAPDEPTAPSQKPQISNSLLYCLVAPILLAVMFGVGACDLPYGYYVFTRITALVLCAIFMIAYTGVKEFLNFPNIAVLIIAILFNPIAPIYFEKFTWVILDIISSAIMLTVSAYIYVKDIRR